MYTNIKYIYLKELCSLQQKNNKYTIDYYKSIFVYKLLISNKSS